MAKAYSITITSSELDKYIGSTEDKKQENLFIQNYISKHTADNITTTDDVYSLLLMAAIIEDKTETIKHIMSGVYSQNIFASTNSNGFSALSILLSMGNSEAFDLMERYGENNNSEIEKANISQEEKKSLYQGILENKFEGLYYSGIIKFLSHFYLDKDIVELEDLCDQSIEDAYALLGISLDFS